VSAEQAFRTQYPFVIETTVEWGDMDAFGHVNNTMYFRYFERARIAFFRNLGWIVDDRNKGVGPILASTRCRFRHALTYPDRILVGTGVSDLEPDRFLMSYGIYSLAQERMAAEGDGFIVSYDYTRAGKADIPGAVHVQLEACETAPAVKRE